jgi:hypothetical protein
MGKLWSDPIYFTESILQLETLLKLSTISLTEKTFILVSAANPTHVYRLCGSMVINEVINGSMGSDSIDSSFLGDIRKEGGCRPRFSFYASSE